MSKFSCKAMWHGVGPPKCRSFKWIAFLLWYKILWQCSCGFLSVSLMVKIGKSNLMICNRVCLNIRDERCSFQCKQKEKNTCTMTDGNISASLCALLDKWKGAADGKVLPRADLTDHRKLKIKTFGKMRIFYRRKKLYLLDVQITQFSVYVQLICLVFKIEEKKFSFLWKDWKKCSSLL